MMQPAILYEDNHLLVLNKPAGWLVQGDKTGDFTLTDWGKAYLKEKYQKPGAVFLHPVHRIDRPVSGAVLFARTDKALSRLMRSFKQREVQKTYIALSLFSPVSKEGRLLHWLEKQEKNNKVRVFHFAYPTAKESILDYQVLGESGLLTILEVHPITGRPHQIRAQLAAVGCPIIGDLKYGAHQPLEDASIGLHCRSMAFQHPVQTLILEVEAPYPPLSIWDAVR
ncbi:MAG: RluA family pseudouridine synthase [Chitinophagales bacterium]|jgi:23S rRNA pseudouridine1911/1915/1917 synthase